MTRKEHLDWCKARALEYLDNGDAGTALASFHSDVLKHEETAEILHNPAITLLTAHTLSSLGQGDTSTVRGYIEGFN